MNKTAKIMFIIGVVLNSFYILFFLIFTVVSIFGLTNQEALNTLTNDIGKTLEYTRGMVIGMLIAFSISLLVEVAVLVLSIRSKRILFINPKHLPSMIILIVAGVFSGVIFYILSGIFYALSRYE